MDCDGERMSNSEKQDPKSSCLDEINVVLEKYGCDLVAVPQWKQDGRGGWYMTTSIAIVERKP